MKLLRYRLLTVMAIGVITSALSLFALVRLMSSTSAQRRERAHDAVMQQVERLAALGPGRAAYALRQPAAGTMIGMRGGFYMPGVSRMSGTPDMHAVHGSTEAPEAGISADSELPPEWRPPVARVIELGRKGRAFHEEPLGGSQLILAAEPAGTGVAWAGLLVPPSRLLRIWSVIVILLAAATALLVTTAISAVVSFRRSATALNRCLRSLAEDLSTPVPRPPMRELSEVADGIVSLAQSLARARESEERLGRELSQTERLAALGRVVAGVAHEVRNPLASIKLRLDLAKHGGALTPDAELAVTHATAEIERLDRLVADLLVVAGRQMGPRLLSEIGGLVQARIDALGPWAAARGVRLHAQGEGRAVVDVESVARALDNLLRNAVEASPVGATVTATVHASPETCRVRVEDSGPGIPSGAELFEPFFTTKPDGTGLGLALSRAIARAHGGDLTYRRVGHGKGSRTRFELALAVAPAPRELAASPGAAAEALA